MDSQLSLSIVEIVVLMLGAIVLGVTIHFFIASKRSLQSSSPAAIKQYQKEAEDWKLRYFNEIEIREKELELLRKKLADSEENNHINSIEAEETRIRNKKLRLNWKHSGISSLYLRLPLPGKPVIWTSSFRPRII